MIGRVGKVGKAGRVGRVGGAGKDDQILRVVELEARQLRSLCKLIG